MSNHSLDSLEGNDCQEESKESNENSNEVTNRKQSRQSKMTENHESVYLKSTKSSSPIKDVTLNETPGCLALNGSLVSSRNLIIAVDSFTKVKEESRLDPRDNRNGNDNVIQDGLYTTNVAVYRRKDQKKEEEEGVKKTLPLSTGCRKTFPRIVTPVGSMSHTKKLSGVVVERPSWRKEESGRRSFSYLESYRRRSDVLRNRRARSSEGSTLSICGDNPVRCLLDVESRASSRFPEDDQSEFSCYRRLMHQASRPLGMSRSCESSQDDGDDHPRNVDSIASLRNIDVGSTSETKLNHPKSPGYRRYSLKDLKSLSVPRRDRSLGPDPVELREKREWLMRRRLYGDAVSTRNRQHIFQESRRTDQKYHYQDPLTNNGVPKKVSSCKAESCGAKNTRGGLKGVVKEFRMKSVATGVTSTSRKSRACPGTCPNSLRVSGFLEQLQDPHLESLQERHLSERKMIEQLVNRGLLF